MCQGYMAGYAQAAFGLMTLDKSKALCLPDLSQEMNYFIFSYA
jgi:hypothetical protein